MSSLPQDAYTLEETYFANIAYSWLIHGNSKRKAGNENYLLYWRIGVTVFEQHSAFMRLTHKPRPMLARRDNINLRKLCYLCAPADQVAKDWIRASWGLVQFYVKRGSDIKRLRFYDGDSYIHASLYFSVMMGTFYYTPRHYFIKKTNKETKQYKILILSVQKKRPKYTER